MQAFNFEGDEALEINFSDVPDNNLLPDGEYIAEVDKVVKKVGPKGDYLSFDFTITDGEFKGRKIFGYILSLSKDSLWRLKQDMPVLGFDIVKNPKVKFVGDEDGLSVPDFVGNPVTILTKVNEYTNKDGEQVKNNRVAKLKSATNAAYGFNL